MVLNICNFIQRTEQVPFELDISAIEDYILLLLLLIYMIDYSDTVKYDTMKVIQYNINYINRYVVR